MLGLSLNAAGIIPTTVLEPISVLYVARCILSSPPHDLLGSTWSVYALCLLEPVALPFIVPLRKKSNDVQSNWWTWLQGIQTYSPVHFLLIPRVALQTSKYFHLWKLVCNSNQIYQFAHFSFWFHLHTFVPCFWPETCKPGKHIPAWNS